MTKLLLFALLCGLGYRLVRATARGRSPTARRPDRAAADQARAVDAEFREVTGDNGREPRR